MLSTLLASAARTASGTAAIAGPDLARLGPPIGAVLRLDVTAASGTSPTLDVFLQVEIASSVWQDLARFTRATAATAEMAHWSALVAPTAALRASLDGAMSAGVQQGPMPSGAWRLKWTIGGTDTPSFTFAVSGEWLR